VNKFCILGNSVATSRSRSESPMAGWGRYLHEFLGPGYEVKNYARDAMTLRGYFTDRFVKMLNSLEPGDFVGIDFGAVEQRVNVPLRYHGPREFKEYLRLYVEAIRGEGATPVVVTPAARCVFDVHGNVVDTHDGYPQYARDAAAETGAGVVDLNLLTTRMLEQVGCTRARGLLRLSADAARVHGAAPRVRTGRPVPLRKASRRGLAGARADGERAAEVHGHGRPGHHVSAVLHRRRRVHRRHFGQRGGPVDVAARRGVARR
jgi:hypothetical protein